MTSVMDVSQQGCCGVATQLAGGKGSAGLVFAHWVLFEVGFGANHLYHPI